ncbi:hypothetical protein B0H34DRAFT_679064 [Crassisporium funariophilum]|nr:hypothetical protein B0H34DRAFT_679064 [Crassisporium funariophilum]
MSGNNMDQRSTPLSAECNQTSLDHITSLERSLCSNFVCCGTQLPDLHALLEHFEEDHIMVLAPNGKPIYPPEGLRAAPLQPALSSSENTPSSSRSSSVLSSPNSTTSPLSPSSPRSASLSDLPRQSSSSFANQKPCLPAGPVYTPFTPNLPVDPACPYPDSTEAYILQEPIYDFSHDYYPTLASPICHITSDEDDDMSDSCADDSPTSPIPTYVYGLDKAQPIGQIPKAMRGNTAEKAHISMIDGIKHAIKSSSSAASSKSNKAKHKFSNANRIPHSKRRDRAYRCPVNKHFPRPRCTKSYLNPNGLKYHMEKGTCKIEDEFELGESEERKANYSSAAPTHSSLPSPSTALTSAAHLPVGITPNNAPGTRTPNLPNPEAGPSTSSLGEVQAHGGNFYYLPQRHPLPDTSGDSQAHAQSLYQNAPTPMVVGEPLRQVMPRQPQHQYTYPPVYPRGFVTSPGVPGGYVHAPHPQYPNRGISMQTETIARSALDDDNDMQISYSAPPPPAIAVSSYCQ